MRYPPRMVQPKRDELTTIGFQEWLTPKEVDADMSNHEGTTLVVVNSICGCAAGMARPGVAQALQNDRVPDRLYTIFAGMELGAVDRARGYFAPYAPSSPQIALFKDGKLVHMLERSNIEGHGAGDISASLTEVFNEHCG